MLEAIGSFFQSLQEWLDPRHLAAGGYFLITLIVYLETGIAMGIIFPGESLVLICGMLASAGTLDLRILIPTLFVAAVLGDATGFAVGSRLGPRVFTQTSVFFRPEYLERANKFYEKYGGRAIILARFVPFIRTFAPIVAGAARMQYRQFVIYNVVGAALWVTSVLLAGYYLGQLMPNLDRQYHYVILLVILISLVVPLFDFLRKRAGRRKAAKDSLPSAADGG